MLGENIKKYRKRNKLTQEQLGEKLELSGVAIMRYEKGQREPGIDQLHKIAEALNVSLNDLLGESEVFDNDFNVDDFDEIAKKYILKLKEALIESGGANNISNTVILQNLIIKQKAERDALQFVKLDRSSPRPEFDIDENGNLITGEKLYLSLYNHYKNEFFTEKLRRLEARFPYIDKYEDEESLISAREYYDNIPKKMIPDYILEKLYPEEIKKIL